MCWWWSTYFCQGSRELFLFFKLSTLIGSFKCTDLKRTDPDFSSVPNAGRVDSSSPPTEVPLAKPGRRPILEPGKINHNRQDSFCFHCKHVRLFVVRKDTQDGGAERGEMKTRWNSSRTEIPCNALYLPAWHAYCRSWTSAPSLLSLSLPPSLVSESPRLWAFACSSVVCGKAVLISVTYNPKCSGYMFTMNWPYTHIPSHTHTHHPTQTLTDLVLFWWHSQLSNFTRQTRFFNLLDPSTQTSLPLPSVWNTNIRLTFFFFFESKNHISSFSSSKS